MQASYLQSTLKSDFTGWKWNHSGQAPGHVQHQRSTAAGFPLPCSLGAQLVFLLLLPPGAFLPQPAQKVFLSQRSDE